MAYSSTDAVSDFGTESSVVHQKNVKVSCVFDEEFFKAVGEMESSFFIVSVTDLWHGLVASESSSHSVIDTLIIRRVYLWVFSSWQPVFRRKDRIGIW